MNFYENDYVKVYRSEDFNYNFLKRNGYTELWGKTKEDDPVIAPMPVILDMEITSICSGPGTDGPCKFCYKSNTVNGKYMSFKTAKNILDKMPKQLTQVAFGVDAKCESNPDWFNIFKYVRELGFIPNVTVADISDETADKLASVCGAVAISRYENKEYCYNSVKKLTDRGITQTNIHIMISKQTKHQVFETLEDIKNDPRLAKLNAIVFLSLKKKGRGKSFECLTSDEFKEIVDKAMSLKVNFGFDSCSAHKFLKSIENIEKYKHLSVYCEPCESSCQSSYINEEGIYFPCSFAEKSCEDWMEGLDVVNCNDFVNDIWNNEKTNKFRKMLLENNRNCPLFEI